MHYHNIITTTYLQPTTRTQLSLTHLLLEVSPVFLINQDQIDVIPHRELLVYVLHGRGQVVAAQEQADRYRLA